MKISVITVSIRPEGLKIVQDSLANQTFPLTDFEWVVELGIPERGHDLNAAYNRALRRSQGELIVSVQDYIKAPPDYLYKFWEAYTKHPRTFFTAPVGKVDNLEYTGKPRWDWRAYSDAKPIHSNWEIDSACASKSALFEIGGFDEMLDGYWSCDNVNVAYRAMLAGYEFAHLFENPVIVYDHDAHMPHPFRKDFDPKFNNERMQEFKLGLTIDYLH